MNVIVLGMHRSGTSAVAGSLAKLGLSTGNGKLLPPHESNPRGFWEQEELMRFNERLLRALGGRWWIPPRMPPVCEQVLRRAGHFLPEAERLLDRIFDESPWVWKDPRLCLLLWFWRPLLHDDVAVVFVYRNPLEVWKSLEKRDGLPARESLLLWEFYNLSALWHAATLPCVVVRYDDLCESPVATLERIAIALLDFGVDVPRDVRRDVFAEAGLRHWRFTAADLAHHPEATREQVELYEFLDELPHACDSFPIVPQFAARLERCLEALENSSEPRWVWELVKRRRRWTVPWRLVVREAKRMLGGEQRRAGTG